MTCTETNDLIGPYVDDDLARETRSVVEAHLLGCRECAWEAMSLLITRGRLREGAGDVVASDAFRSRAMSRLRADNGHLSTKQTDQEDAIQFPLPMSLPECSPKLSVSKEL